MASRVWVCILLIGALCFLCACTPRPTTSIDCVPSPGQRCNGIIDYPEGVFQKPVPPDTASSTTTDNADSLPTFQMPEDQSYIIEFGEGFLGEKVALYLNAVEVFKGSVETDEATGVSELAVKFKENGNYFIVDPDDVRTFTMPSGSGAGPQRVDSISVCVNGCLLTGPVSPRFKSVRIAYIRQPGGFDGLLKMEYRQSGTGAP